MASADKCMVYHGAMPAPHIALAIAPSRALRRAVAILHVLAGVAVCAAALPWWGQGVGLAAVAASLLAAMRAGPVLELHGHADGRLAVRQDGDWLAAVVAPDTLVWAWLVVLRYRVAGSARWANVVVLPDSLAADDFRRLRVWLRWRARPDAHGGDAEPERPAA